jgi:alanine dehydrogenase
MKIGCPKEIKPQEFRVGLTPAAVREAVAHGHDVLIETGAGHGAGFEDTDYIAAGAAIAAGADQVFAEVDMVVKVKEPQAAERARLRAGQVLFTYLHLAPDPEQTRDLLNSGVTAIAYETVTDAFGTACRFWRPCRRSRAACAAGGRMGAAKGQWRARCPPGWRPGCRPRRGRRDRRRRGRNAGGADRVGHGGGCHGARPVAAPAAVSRRRLSRRFKTRYASADTTAELIRSADLVIGAVLIPGAAAPKLVTRAQLSTMKHGAVIVDVAIDQGGCFETSRATTHEDPIYEVDGIVHYCVANMPGAVARSSTIALGNATMPFMLALADKGWRTAMQDDAHLLAGLNTHEGKLTNYAVGKALGIDVVSPSLVVKG